MSSFSEKLQNIIQLSGIKYATFAEAVNYDMSYVSKWINGKTLPAEKNIEVIVNSIISVILDNALDENLEALIKKYDCDNYNQLEDRLHEILVKAFWDSKGVSKEVNSEFYAELSSVEVAKKILSHEISGKIAALIDIFNLDHESRLLLAGIIDGEFSVNEDKQSSYSLILNTESLRNEEVLYNTIFFIHMMTSLSGVNLQIYKNNLAFGKIVYAVKDKYAISAMIISGEKKLMAVGETEDKSQINFFYQKIKLLINHDKKIFTKTTMVHLLNSNKYIRSLISTNVNIVLGHITEHLLPNDVFGEICEHVSFYENDELKKTHILVQNVIQQTTTFVVIYESALSNFAITGELDFFNHKFILDVDQRKRVLDYIKSMVNKTNLKIINSYLCEEFKYISNPCIFNSDLVCYLRLENGRYEDNIMLLEEKSVKEMFDAFYNVLWNERKDVVVESGDIIISKIEHYKSLVKLMDIMD